MKRYTDRKRAEVDEYKVGDLMMLSTKNLKYQIVDRGMKKLIEKFVTKMKKVQEETKAVLGKV